MELIQVNYIVNFINFLLIKVGSHCGWNNDYTDFAKQRFQRHVQYYNIYISPKKPTDVDTAQSAIFAR